MPDPVPPTRLPNAFDDRERIGSDEGGDPPCWAHLFDDTPDNTPDDARSPAVPDQIVVPDEPA